MSFARWCSGQFVTSQPAKWMLPVSTRKVPAIAFNNVDLPEPLVPMTTTHEPSSMATSTPFSERTSFWVPGLKVLEILQISSTCGSRLPFLRFCQPIYNAGGLLHPLQESGQHKRQQHKDRRDEFQIIGIQPPAQRDGHKQPEEYGPHHGTGNRKPQTLRTNE